MEKKSTLLFMLILGTAFWGISFPVTKLAIGAHSSSVFLFYRFLLATMLMTIIFWKHVKSVSKTSLLTGAALAVPLVMGISLQTLGIKYSAASQTAFIAGTSVILVPIMKLVMYKTAAPLKIWIAALIALAGLFIISITGKFAINKGDLFTIAGSFAFAYYLIVVEKQAAIRSLLPAIVPMFAVCTLLMFLLALRENPVTWAPADNYFWMGIGFCALFSTAYMYTVSNIAQRYISAEKVAIIYLFEPVFGAVAAFFILGENMTGRLLIGGALIFIATLISELKPHRFLRPGRSPKTWEVS